jgi:hypothetical protein
MTPLPIQYTTADASLIGDVDGANRSYYFVPAPELLLCSATGIRSFLMFWNGLLVDQPGDYLGFNGYFVFNSSVQFDTATALAYTGTAPSILRLSDTSITAFGNTSLRISFGNAAFVAQRQFILFRNGLRLTDGPDYTSSGPWINLVAGQEIQDGDQYSTLIGPIGTASTTNNGSITGAVDGTNQTFGIPAGSNGLWLFWNGLFQTEGFDYVRAGNNVTFLVSIPQSGDVLTGQSFASEYSQLSTFDGSLAFSTAAATWVFVDGLLQPQSGAAQTSGNTVTLSEPAGSGSIVTAESWVRIASEPEQPALNLGTQYSSDDGGISGDMDSSNAVFTINSSGLITQVMLFVNRRFLVQNRDYAWAGNTIMMLAGSIPDAGDVLTAMVFSD